MTEVFEHDTGTIFRLTVKESGTAVNISTATTKQLWFQKPNGDLLKKAGSFYTDGTDGKLQYTTVVADLDMTGTWKVQVYFVTASGAWRTSFVDFVVHG